ncbi:MAG: hypothetical protein KGL53_06270, partial [Elusimicrobia bacterium]|nr:hypothetical protein [Elusimicrobiota bacterium]
GAPPDAAGDLAALGACVERALAGSRPDEDLAAVAAKCAAGGDDGYASAGALLADLEARRRRLPVSPLAGRPVYRLRRFLRRNAFAVILASVAAAGAGGVMWQQAAKNAALKSELAGSLLLRGRAAVTEGDEPAAALLFAQSDAVLPSAAARRDAEAVLGGLAAPRREIALGSPALSAAVGPGGELLAGGEERSRLWGADGRVVFEDPPPGELAGALEIGSVQEAAFSRDGSRFLVASPQGTVVLGDARTGARLAQAQGTFGALSPDGRLFATSDWKGSVVLMDDKTASEIPHTGAVTLWDAATGKATGVRVVPRSGSGKESMDTPGVDFSPDGRTFLTCLKGAIQLWDSTTGRPRGRPIRYDGEVGLAIDPLEEARFSPDGRAIL